MEICPILASSNPSALWWYMMVMYHQVSCVELLSASIWSKCWRWSLVGLLFKLWLKFFNLGFWLELLLRVTWCQRKKKICWSYFKTYRFYFVGQTSYTGFIYKEQTVSISSLKQVGFLKKWRSTFLLACDILCGRTELLTGAPLHLALTCTLNSVIIFLSTHSLIISHIV